MGNYKCGKLYSLALSNLTPNPDQPRKVFSDPEIQALAESIKEKGLLQPILVKIVENGQIIIVSGERRFRAHQLLQREKIPAWFTTGDPEELALVENLVREDLSAMETAEALKKLANRFENRTLDDIGKIIGKAQNTVSEILSLNNLSENIREKVRGDKRFALRELKKIASKRTHEAQEKLFSAYVTKIEAESQEKKTRSRLKGAALHKQKIKTMLDYFSTMAKKDRIRELKTLSKDLIELQTSIERILFKLGPVDTNIDASKFTKVYPEPVIKKRNKDKTEPEPQQN